MTAPLNMAEAADALGICKRSLTAYVQDYPYYERRGSRKVFYPEHIDALREAIDQCSESKPTLEPASIKSPAQSSAGAKELEQARARQTAKRRRMLQQQSSGTTGNVVLLENRR